MGNPFLDFGPDRVKSYFSGLALNAVTRKIPDIYVDKEAENDPSFPFIPKQGGENIERTNRAENCWRFYIFLFIDSCFERAHLSVIC